MILSGGIVLSAEPSEGPPSAPCLLSHAPLHFPFSPSLWNDDEVSNGFRRRVQNRAEQQLLPLGGQPPLTSLPHYGMFFLPCQLLSKDHKALRNLTTFAPAVSFSLASLTPFGLQMEAPWLHTGGSTLVAAVEWMPPLH